MILQALHDLYSRLEAEPKYGIAPYGYSNQRVSFVVVLYPDGRLFEIQDARQAVDGKVTKRRVRVPGSTKPPGLAFNPCFLWDSGAYLLGYYIPKDDSDEEAAKKARAEDSFMAFRKRHLRLRSEINCGGFDAVCRFLECWKPTDHLEYPVLEEVGTGFGVFQILGDTAYVHDRPEVISWWNAQLPTLAKGRTGQCLISGDTDTIALVHPKIKGVSGGLAMGGVIVGFKEPAYESYGKTQSENAPVSVQSAYRYTSAINALLDGPMSTRHRLSLADATVVFWTEKPTLTEVAFPLLAGWGSAAIDDEAQDEGLRQKLEAFLTALRAGRERYGELESEEDTRFCILGLAPNAARLSVRSFHQGTIESLVRNLRRHFEDIRVQGRPTASGRRGDPEFPSLWLLLQQTAREAKEIPPVLAGPLLRSVITGIDYPDGLYNAVLRRIRLDSTVNYARACVIKGYLKRNRGLEVKMGLDKDRTDSAYRLGRLFAALEKTQGDALGGSLNATIRDRFYGSASASPRGAFPRLLRTYQHHIAKLDRGRKVWREQLIQEILEPISDFPARLDLAEQGLFAIGYYHQMQDFYTKKTDDQNADLDTQEEGEDR